MPSTLELGRQGDFIVNAQPCGRLSSNNYEAVRPWRHQESSGEEKRLQIVLW